MDYSEKNPNHLFMKRSFLSSNWPKCFDDNVVKLVKIENNIVDMKLEDNDGQIVDVTVEDDEGEVVYVIVEENEDQDVESNIMEETVFKKDTEIDITSSSLNEVNVEMKCKSELNTLENVNKDDIVNHSKCNYFESPSCSYTSHMNSSNGKRAGESFTFKKKWTDLYFFVKFDDSCLCLICHKQIYVCKKYSLERHFLSRHKNYTDLVGAERSEKIDFLKDILEERQNSFEKLTQGIKQEYVIESKSKKKHFKSANSYVSYVNMNKRKRKIADVCAAKFHEKWTELYFFIKYDDSCLCLICHRQIHIFKKYNLKRHFTSMHKSYIHLKESKRSEKIASLKDALKERYILFKKPKQESVQNFETDTTFHSFDVVGNVILDEIGSRSKYQDFKNPNSHLSHINNRRRKAGECPKFNENWTELYFFIEVDDGCLCLICNKHVPIYKKYNLERHFMNSHKDYIDLTGSKRSDKIAALKDSLEKTLSLSQKPTHLNKQDTKTDISLNEINVETKSLENLDENFFFRSQSPSSTSHMNDRTDNEGRTFNEKWTELYFFIKFDNGCLCLICNKQVSINKKYNLKRHFMSRHKDYLDLKGAERSEEIGFLKDVLEERQNSHKKLNQGSEQDYETGITLNSSDEVNEDLKYNIRLDVPEKIIIADIEEKSKCKHFKIPSCSHTSHLNNHNIKSICECSKFNEEWTDLYFFVEFDDSWLCLICNDAISVCSPFKLEKHFLSRHKNYIDLKGPERSDRIAFLKDALEKRKTFLRDLLREVSP